MKNLQKKLRQQFTDLENDVKTAYIEKINRSKDYSKHFITHKCIYLEDNDTVIFYDNDLIILDKEGYFLSFIDNRNYSIERLIELLTD